MRLKFKHNLDAMFSQLEENVVKRVPLALAIAMTKTAKDVQAAEVDEMRAVFDRPTPYTLNSVYISPATPQKLEASVFLKDDDRGGGSHPATEYLIPEIDGGVRVDKRSEYILRKAGFLPDGMQIVGGRAAEYDAYGNVSTGLIRQILSALRVSEQGAGSTSNRPLAGTSSVGSSAARKARARARQGDFFVAQRNSPKGRHLAPGIYRRFAGKRIQPVLMFVRRPRYRGILEFERVAQQTTDEVFPDHLREQLAISVRKAA